MRSESECIITFGQEAEEAMAEFINPNLAVVGVWRIYVLCFRKCLEQSFLNPRSNSVGSKATLKPWAVVELPVCDNY